MTTFRGQGSHVYNSQMLFDGWRAYAEVNPDMPENTGEGVAATPALALCIAALRAREGV